MFYLLILVILSSFCAKQIPTPKSIPMIDTIELINNNIEEIPNIVYLSEEEFNDKFKQVMDFQLGDSISLDSPKRFLQISILFTLAQNSNYSIITQQKNISDDDINNFLNKQRESFYQKLNITEAEYINYGINHSAEIQEFLATNSTFNEVYEIVQLQVTD
ncbi:MAG: hypothetical protein ACRC0X_05475 [Brevinema sp.]